MGAGSGALGAGEVHLARVLLEGSSTEAEALLDEGEQERAARFLRPDPRRRFILARAGLRRWIAQALDCDPRDLHFAEERHGRPHLAGEYTGALEFNLAHSGELALIALAARGPLGVDLEAERPIDRLDALAEEVLGSAELVSWRDLPVEARPTAFLRAWTRKEALLKATGIGLSGGLRELDVRGPSPLAVALHADGEDTRGNGSAPRLWIRDLEVAPGYRAALASPWQQPRIAWLHLQGE